MEWLLQRYCMTSYQRGEAEFGKILPCLIYIKTSVRQSPLVSPCDSLTCQNEGSCRVEAGVAACFCKGDYSGSLCEGKH
jgi:hypothetical protein